jgi:hypothetical protein
MKRKAFYSVAVTAVIIISVIFLTAQTNQNINFTKSTRKVISYNFGGVEYADMIDYIELEWTKTDGTWLPADYRQLYDYTTFEAAKPPLNNYKMSSYFLTSGQHRTVTFQGYVGLREDLYTLVITVYQKDGNTGSLILYGGEGSIGEEMIWNVLYLPPDSNIARKGHSSWNNSGSLLWKWADNEPEIPTFVYINSYYSEGDPNGKNKIIFADLVRDPFDPFITIELDGSFFP